MKKKGKEEEKAVAGPIKEEDADRFPVQTEEKQDSGQRIRSAENRAELKKSETDYRKTKAEVTRSDQK